MEHRIDCDCSLCKDTKYSLSPNDYIFSTGTGNSIAAPVALCPKHNIRFMGRCPKCEGQELISAIQAAKEMCTEEVKSEISKAITDWLPMTPPTDGFFEGLGPRKEEVQKLHEQIAQLNMALCVERDKRAEVERALLIERTGNRGNQVCCDHGWDD